MCCAQVEKAPVVIKAGISKADAEELSKKIEAGKGKQLACIKDFSPFSNANFFYFCLVHWHVV